MTENPIHTPSREDIQAVIREANQMRADTMKMLLAAAGRGIWRGFAAVVAAIGALAQSFADAHRARLLYERLSSLSDRELNDIGLTRGDIPAVVAGTFQTGDEPAPAPAASAEITTLRPAPSAQEVREAA